MSKNFTMSKGKTIRDPIHGDIFFPNKFLAITDTSEFQRLRRIHQLSVAYLVFPGAEHTRFSHSIGTYYVMQKIIEHFKPIMKSINLELNERDINLALAVALLHDVGHGPFSHAFERAIPKSDSHEEWTIKIITSDESNINRVLKENFDERFPKDLADIIRKERIVKKDGIKPKTTNVIDLFFILTGLISSQLDADRMDYLIRDTKHSGVAFGNIDIERLISAMTLTVYKDNYYVCVFNKFLPDVENYLLARYHMHREVYLHDVKCEMEIVIKKILERAVELYSSQNNIMDTIPGPLFKLFKGQEISVEEYTSLDDHIMFSIFSRWMKAEDPILSRLCACIIDRDKYNKIRILNGTEESIKEFKEELSNILSKYGHAVSNYDNEYFWLESTEKYSIYKKKKDNIWILKNDGTINDISEVSKIISEGLNGKKTMTFINYDILNAIEDLKDSDLAINDVKDLVEIYDNRNHIEIEKKYVFHNKEVFDKVEEVIRKWDEYQIDTSGDHKIQKDYYYDTDDKYLYKENKTLRFRETEDSLKLTIKTPTKASSSYKDGANIQNERFEYEVVVCCEDKDENRNNIVKYLPELNEEDKWNNLNRSLTVINNRRKIYLSKNDVEFEMVFDDVNYVNINGKQKSDYQIEIELKSDYIHRINLKILSDYLESKVPELMPMNESKYKRGLKLTK